MLQDKGSLKFSLEDIFHSWIQIENSFAIKESEFYYRNINDTQRFGVAFSYRFGSDKFLRNRKQADNAAEEKSRVK